MSKKVIIIGAGENSKVISNILRKEFTVSGFLDDTKKGKKILGVVSDFNKFSTTHSFFISLGNNKKRTEIFDQMIKNKARFVNAVHPSAQIEQEVTVGQNVFIGALSLVNVNTVINDSVFINNGCIIEHDNIIESGVHVTPGVITGGGVKIESNAFIGLGAIINDHIMIGSNSIIGSGSVVIMNIPASTTAVGIPAKVINK